MRYVAQAIRLFCSLVESPAMVEPKTLWRWETVQEALEHDQQLLVELTALPEHQRTRVFRYCEAFEPLESLGDIWEFPTPDDAASFIKMLEAAGLASEPYTATVVHFHGGGNHNMIRDEAEVRGGWLYKGPKIHDSVDYVDASLPWDLYCEGISTKAVCAALLQQTERSRRLLSESSITLDERLEKFEGRLQSWIHPRSPVPGVPNYVVEGLRIGGWLTDTMLDRLLEQDPAADPATAARDRGGVADVQPDDAPGAAATSQAEPQEEPEKPTEHRPTEEEGAPDGDVTLADGTVVPEEVLKTAFVKFLDNVGTQLEQGIKDGKPEPRGQEAEAQPEEEPPEPQEEQPPQPQQPPPPPEGAPMGQEQARPESVTQDHVVRPKEDELLEKGELCKGDCAACKKGDCPTGKRLGCPHMKKAEAVEEGLFDPYILKAIFLAGGGGSGKGFISNLMFGTMKDQATTAMGLKSVNSDDILMAIAKGKIGATPFDIKRELGGEVGQAARGRAKALIKKRHKGFVGGRLGLIIDGTAKKPAKILKTCNALKEVGYDCYMVFVDTSLDVALARNASRARQVPEDLIRQAHGQVQAAKDVFKRTLGKRMVVIDNSRSASEQDIARKLTPQFHRLAMRFLGQPIRNPVGRAWVVAEAEGLPASMKRKIHGKVFSHDRSRPEADLLEQPRSIPVVLPKGLPLRRNALSEGTMARVVDVAGSRLVLEAAGQRVICDPRYALVLADGYDTDAALAELSEGGDPYEVATRRLNSHRNGTRPQVEAIGAALKAVAGTAVQGAAEKLGQKAGEKLASKLGGKKKEKPKTEATDDEMPSRTAPSTEGTAAEVGGETNNPGNRGGSGAAKDAGVHTISTLKPNKMGKGVKTTEGIAHRADYQARVLKQAKIRREALAKKNPKATGEGKTGGKTRQGKKTTVEDVQSVEDVIRGLERAWESLEEQLDTGQEAEMEATSQGFADAADRLKELRTAAFALSTDDLVRLNSLLLAIGNKGAAGKVEKIRTTLQGLSDMVKKAADELEKAHMAAGVGDAGMMQEPTEPNGEPMPAEPPPEPTPEPPPANGAPPAPAPAPVAPPVEALEAPPEKVLAESPQGLSKARWTNKVRGPFAHGQIVWATKPQGSDPEVWVAEDPHTRKGIYALESSLEFLEHDARDTVMEVAIRRVLDSHIPEHVANGMDYLDAARLMHAACADLGLSAKMLAEVHRVAGHGAHLGSFTVSFSAHDQGLLAATNDPIVMRLADSTQDGGSTVVPGAVLVEAAKVLRDSPDPAQWRLADALEQVVALPA